MTFSKKQSRKITFLQWQNSWRCMKHASLSVIWVAECKRCMPTYALRRKNDINHTYSDSYDLVQECALFLCNHYGKRLNDVLAHDKKGKAIIVKIACIRSMSKLITRKTSDNYRSVSLDALTPVSEPSCEIEEDIVKDYTAYDSIVDSLNLTDNMRIALECRQNGLSYPEIATILERAQSTVFEYFIKMRQRYNAIYG